MDPPPSRIGRSHRAADPFEGIPLDGGPSIPPTWLLA
jgi:hypothetical protein